MSKVKIEGNASGTGTLTISAPNTNTDRTLTLPDGAGEILLANGDGSNLTGITAAVKQYAYGEYSTETTINSSTFTDTGLQATITPTSSSSKIIVVVSLAYAISANPSGCSIRILRGSTEVYSDTTGGDYGQYLGSAYGNFRGNWIEEDSPASTSALTYKIQAITPSNSCIFHRYSSKSSILLLEV